MLVANVVAALCAIVIVGFAAWAVASTPSGAPWPMQWALDGTVNWRASRAVALALSVGLAGIVLGIVAIAANSSGQPLMLIVVSLVYVAIMAAYFLAVVRNLGAGPT